MINYWWVTRPKRRLNSIPEVLSVYAGIALNQEWNGQKSVQLDFEDALEKAGLKRVGERLDQAGGGARTYKAWLSSLGLIYIDKETSAIKLTQAGNEIVRGNSPHQIISDQVLKYQFPSSFSMSRGVQVSTRFRIQPFIFLLKLLMNETVRSLSEEEIAKIVIVEAETDSDECFSYIVNQIEKFRERGDSMLCADFNVKFASSRGSNQAHLYSHLYDTANTFTNWLEYTQLAVRSTDDRRLRILPEKHEDVISILNQIKPLIGSPETHVEFQNAYGTVNMASSLSSIITSKQKDTSHLIVEQEIRKAFIREALVRPITSISVQMIEKISQMTEIKQSIVNDLLHKHYPKGAVGMYMTEFFDLAFSGQDKSDRFIFSINMIMSDVFGLDAQIIEIPKRGVFVVAKSQDGSFTAIIEGQAVSTCSLDCLKYNDMANNIRKIEALGIDDGQIFYFIIAGGFSPEIDEQLDDVKQKTGVGCSAMSATNLIKLIDNHLLKPYSHNDIKILLSTGGLIDAGDIRR